MNSSVKRENAQFCDSFISQENERDSRTPSLECTLGYYEYVTRASRSDTGTSVMMSLMETQRASQPPAKILVMTTVEIMLHVRMWTSGHSCMT